MRHYERENSNMRKFFSELATIAAKESLPLFRSGLSVDNKLAKGFDPVTEADKATERAIRTFIESRFPEHGILGEEYGLVREEASLRWVIDPIDGTRAYITGIPVWGTLVGLLDNGKATHGMMSQPYLGELFYGGPEGSVLIKGDTQTALKTNQCIDIASAKIMSAGPEFWTDTEKPKLDILAAQSQLIRYGADCYAFAMVASGEVDVVVECGLKPYDICGLIPIIEGAGGMVAQPDGAPAEEGGIIIAAATPELFKSVARLWDED